MNEVYKVKDKRVYENILAAKAHVTEVLGNAGGNVVRPMIRWYTGLNFKEKPLPVVLDLTLYEIENIPRIGKGKAEKIISAIEAHRE